MLRPRAWLPLLTPRLSPPDRLLHQRAHAGHPGLRHAAPRLAAGDVQVSGDLRRVL